MLRPSILVILLGLGYVQCFKLSTSRRPSQSLVAMYSIVKKKPFFDIFGRLGNVEVSLGNLEVRLGNVEVRLGNLENDVKDIKKSQNMSNVMFFVSQIPVWIMLVRQMS